LESRCSIHLPEHVAPTELVIQVGWDVYKYSAPLELARLVVAFAAQRNLSNLRNLRITKLCVDSSHSLLIFTSLLVTILFSFP
jgi:hypothetical protein